MRKGSCIPEERRRHHRGTRLGNRRPGRVAMEAAPGQKYSVNVVGVYSFPKKASEAITAGADVYWDNTNGVITATAESHILAGYAIADAAAADAVVSIKINA